MFVVGYGNTVPMLRIADAGPTLEIDMNGPPLDVTVTEDLEISIVGGSPLTSQYLDLRDGSGYTVTWPVGIDWGSAGAPTLSDQDTFVFYCVYSSDGTTTEIRGMQVLAGGWDL